jgi:uncharacterized protein YndB with AHSA1/START domain
MTTAEKTAITVQTTVQAPVQQVWALWTEPQHIVRWNHASADWHSPEAENDLREEGRFRFRMESRDGSMGFDFTGTYNEVIEHKRIRYTMDDDRKADIVFAARGNETTITETFEAEITHAEDLQRQGWQAILDNFKAYAEAPGTLDKQHFQVTIKAPAGKVYQTMLAEETYRQWTAAFCPTSFYEGSWDKGSKILFIGVDKDGNRGGMVSRIRENIPERYVSIEHIGVLQNSTEITSGPEVEGWAGAQENYTFTREGSTTLLSVDMDVQKDFHAFFAETWPKALAKLKELCEA